MLVIKKSVYLKYSSCPILYISPITNINLDSLGYFSINSPIIKFIIHDKSNITIYLGSP